MTRITTLLLLFAFVAVAAFWTSPAQAGKTEDMIKAANALDEAFTAAMNSGDAEALAKLYWNSPETVVYMPDAMEARGYAAIHEQLASMATSFSGATFELLESHQLPVGDVVIGYGLWQMTMPGPDGQPTQMQGRFTDVKAERDGQWVYILDHASVPAMNMVRTD